MANRWTRKAQEPQMVATTTDPVSRKLSQAVQDLRNGTLVKQLSGGDTDDVTIQAIFKPIVATMAEQIMAQMKQGQAPQQEDVNSIMTEHLKQRLLQKQIADLDRNGGQSNGGTPKDVMAFAEGAVNIQKAAADTAMAGQERERQLRLEAEQNAGEMAAYARQEEQQKASMQMEWAEKMYQMMNAAAERAHKVELDFRDYQMKATVENLEKTAQDAIARISSASQEMMATKDQLHQLEKENLKLQYGHELEKQKIAMPLDKDPQYIHQMNYVLHNRRLQDAEIIKMEKETESKLKTDEMIRESIPQVFQTVREVMSGGISFNNPFGGNGDGGMTGSPADAPGLGGS